MHRDSRTEKGERELIEGVGEYGLAQREERRKRERERGRERLHRDKERDRERDRRRRRMTKIEEEPMSAESKF